MYLEFSECLLVMGLSLAVFSSIRVKMQHLGLLGWVVSNKNGNSQQKPDAMLEYKTGYAPDEMYQFARIIAR